ncbi:MAG: cytochrome P450 [Rickettsiaceae bacterium]
MKSLSVLDPNLLLEPSFHQGHDKYKLWEYMRENCPIYKHCHDDFPTFYSITRYEDIKKVYQNHHLFSSKKGVLMRTLKQGEDPGSNLTLALTDPPKHRQLRNIAKSWFSASYVKSIESKVTEKIKSMLLAASSDGGCDFTQDITSPLTLSITCSILGVPESEHLNVLKWCHDAFTNGVSLINNKDFMIFMGEFMEYKRLHPENDLASAIIHGFIDDRNLTEREILLNFENLIGATENASLSLSSGILALIQNEESMVLLKKERELIPLAIEEMLRWASSASHSMRTVTEDTVFGGVKFEVGSKVVLWLPSANRDPEIFDQPFFFNICRMPNNHIALGYGEHFCIGNILGKMQARVLLNEMLDSNIKLSLESEPSFLSSIYVNGPEYFPVIVQR